MKIKLDTTKCLSCGLCESLAPTVFTLKTGIVTVCKDQEKLTPKEQEQAHTAASSCPSGVISLID